MLREGVPFGEAAEVLQREGGISWEGRVENSTFRDIPSAIIQIIFA